MAFNRSRSQSPDLPNIGDLQIETPRGTQRLGEQYSLYRLFTGGLINLGGYSVSSGKRVGLFGDDDWDLAGDATQGVPGGHVRRLQRRIRHGPRYKAYVVFKGRRPGVYTTM